MITGLTLISGTPRKNGKISILLEADKTTANMRSLVELYERSLSLDIEPTDGLPFRENTQEENHKLLAEISDRCQQIQDLIVEKLEPSNPDTETITDLGGEWEPLTAPDELPSTHDDNIGMKAPENEFYGEK